jgi:MFS family permease
LVAFAEIFGKKKIGEIMGLVTSIMTLASTVGPILGAICLSRDQLELFFYPMAIIAFVLGVCCHFVADP